MRIEAFFQEIHVANKNRPRSHHVVSGASRNQISAWETDHGVELPDDLVELLQISNGVATHQMWLEGQALFEGGAFSIYSLEDIRPAPLVMYGLETGPEPQMDSWLAIGAGPDGDLFFIFDTARRRYLLVHPIVPEEAEDLGPSISAVLDQMDPRRTEWSV